MTNITSIILYEDVQYELEYINLIVIKLVIFTFYKELGNSSTNNDIDNTIEIICDIIRARKDKLLNHK